jgi:hypothetical protein
MRGVREHKVSTDPAGLPRGQAGPHPRTSPAPEGLGGAARLRSVAVLALQIAIAAVAVVATVLVLVGPHGSGEKSRNGAANAGTVRTAVERAEHH